MDFAEEISRSWQQGHQHSQYLHEYKIKMPRTAQSNGQTEDISRENVPTDDLMKYP